MIAEAYNTKSLTGAGVNDKQKVFSYRDTIFTEIADIRDILRLIQNKVIVLCGIPMVSEDCVKQSTPNNSSEELICILKEMKNVVNEINTDITRFIGEI